MKLKLQKGFNHFHAKLTNQKEKDDAYYYHMNEEQLRREKVLSKYESIRSTARIVLY